MKSIFVVNKNRFCSKIDHFFILFLQSHDGTEDVEEDPAEGNI